VSESGELPEVDEPQGLSDLVIQTPTSNFTTTIMSQIPKDQWERLQVILRNRSRAGGFGSGGGGGGSIGASVGLLVLGLGGWALSNSLFNGEDLYHLEYLPIVSKLFNDGLQLMVVIAQSNTLASVV
jgi:hypothetical protein